MRHVLALLFIAIKAFAGEDIEKAHFLPRDREFLIEPDEHVRHYDVTSAP